MLRAFSKPAFSLLALLLCAFALAMALPGCALLQMTGGEDDEFDDPVARVASELRDEKLGTPLSLDDVERVENAKLNGDVTPGMHGSDVLGAWGAPVRVEPSSASEPGSERWLYKDGLSRFRGIQATRIIYFENGRVVGWETSQNP